MRILKIGRDNSCDIKLHSNHVSANHAEITLLNNGDMKLEDKGSTNGTFVMNKQIQPGKPVGIKRGDAIRFADVELNWADVPLPEDNSKYRAIYGIGTNLENDVRVTGNTVSRYHATLKIDKKGRAYIQDHSKNGTTVNGTKIPTGQDVRIKRNDAIVCGGVPVSLASLIGGGGDWRKVLGVAAGIAALLAIAFGIWKIIDNGSHDEPSIEALTNATACVYGEFIIDVTVKDDPLYELLKEHNIPWPEKWEFGLDDNNQLKMGTEVRAIGLKPQEIHPVPYTGTAFFISEFGEMGTNRHVAVPWSSLSKAEEERIRQAYETLIKGIYDYVVELLAPMVGGVDARAYYTRLLKSPIDISGHHEFLGVLPSGYKHNPHTLKSDVLTCQVIADSGDDKKDVALLRLNSKQTPDDIIKKGYFHIENARVDEQSLQLGEELTTMGYPSGFEVANVMNEGKEILPTTAKISVSNRADDNQFQFQGMGQGGQSGSPIIDKDRRLVGVLYGGFGGTDITYGCNIKHLVELFEKNKAR